ncbi:MAG: DNA cytosine methyltransferase [Phototrophicaceae bacterium]
MKTVELFSGCGGMSLGFQNAGFAIQAGFDSWKIACDVYQANFDHPIYCLDLSHETVIELIAQFNPEMIIGGPPCQDFSSAGKRDESLGRADLTIRYAQIVSTLRPQWVVMENVDRVIKSKSLQIAKQLLSEAGYGLTEQVLVASLCGVPQNRKRYFLVGELNGEQNALKPYLQHNLAQKPMTIHDYLGDTLNTEFYYRHPRSYQRRAIFSIYEPSPTIRGVNRPIPQNYQPHPSDATHTKANFRPLTTLERSYLQTFPHTFKWHGTKTQMEQLIGNAVPVKLAEYVARAIKQYLEDAPHQMTRAHPESVQLSLW